MSVGKSLLLIDKTKVGIYLKSMVEMVRSFFDSNVGEVLNDTDALRKKALKTAVFKAFGSL